MEFVKSEFFIKENSIKPFHCTESECDNQSLFGDCPISHPFVYDDGKRCCSITLDTYDKARNTQSTSYVAPWSERHRIFGCLFILYGL